MFRFEDPWLLVFGLVLVPVFYGYFERKGSGRIRFSSLTPFGRIPPSLSVQLRHTLIVLRCMGIGLLVIALARPQAGQKETEIITEGIDIMLCLDTSGSMRALDFEREGKRTDRLDVVILHGAMDDGVEKARTFRSENPRDPGDQKLLARDARV